ncbi:EAL domain-containing protein [Novispirillum itersonii]|uniref:Diguanylate cyclase (GGDEF)-like protein/PAS domain S-box-containing protein n=1 Tax=Novispirillum itersonii TaxID=189 RepID=A0A7W9ZKB7_NOVIT|nr:EAL domain-containing protein [Novispirillum itersonii]MBB6212067.1 diguanylate cyclase (GGDEF)-like protein/PAS domain S-box-containing protein [Novispirillum itersonii]
MQAWRRVLAGWVVCLILIVPILAQAGPPRVLLINSYHKGYRWTDEQSNAIEDGLLTYAPEATLEVFYLDWKRHPEQATYENAYATLRDRYRAVRPDLVAATDDAALIFTLMHRETLFAGIPVVYAGVLKEDAERLIGTDPLVTGVNQSMDPLGTLQLARSLSPYRKALLVRDGSESSTAFEAELRTAAQKLTPPMEIESLHTLSFGQILARIRTVEPDTAILLGSYASDTNGMILPLPSFVRRVTDEAGGPVFGFYRYQLDHGIAGGSLLSGTTSGVQQARIMTDVLQGVPVQQIPRQDGKTAERLADYGVLRRHGLSPALLAPDVRLVNRPVSVFEQYALVIVATLIIIIALLMLAVFLLFNIRQRRTAEQALRRKVQDLRQSRTELARSEERYRLASGAARDVIWEWDLRTGLRHFSGRVDELMGIDGSALKSLPKWIERIHPQDQAKVRGMLDDYLSGRRTEYRVEYRIQKADGNYIWLQSNAKALTDEQGVPYLLVGTYTDITEAKRHQEHIDFLAYHDVLTELPNRENLRLQVRQRIEETPDAPLALIFIDMDNFKYINDSAGHTVGDRLLVQTAGRLQRAAGADRVVARLGGDEFVVVLLPEDMDDLENRRTRLINAFRAPFDVDGQTFYMGCSAGLVMYPDDGTTFEELLQNADIAMYQAKAAGKGGMVKYDQSMSERTTARVRLFNRLRTAESAGAFAVYYQPQVRATDGRIRGAEALLRWRDAELGMVPPDQFIPACEETGQIIPVGEWVLRQTCRMVRRLEEAGVPDLILSVNVSVVQLMQSDFVKTAARIAEQEQVDPRRLELEITESVMMGAYDEASRRLRALRDIGFNTSLDDFGVGYSSLTYLRQFPFSTLKLDKSFVKGLPEERTDCAMVRSIIRIAEDLGLETVGEGVEVDGQRDVLAESGCTWLQGYLIGRPMPEADLPGFFAGWPGFSAPAYPEPAQ